MIEHYFVCPHCWQNQLKIVDSSSSLQEFIEDCEVCCNPIEFIIQINNFQINLFLANSIEQ